MTNSGLYTFFYCDIDHRILMKVGKAKNIQERLDQHRTSNVGLYEGPTIPVHLNKLDKTEKDFLSYLSRLYSFAGNSRETFYINSIEDALSIIQEFCTTSNFQGRDIKNITYTFNNLEGNSFDVRDYRPSCAFSDKTAQVKNEVGLEEKYRTVYTVYDRNMQKIKPQRVFISQEHFASFHAGQKTAEFKMKEEILSGKINLQKIIDENGLVQLDC